MNKKITVIVIGDKRRMFSFEVSTAFLIITLSVLIGFILILTTFFMIRTYTKKETYAKIELHEIHRSSDFHYQ
jgi:hypothetical protein